MALNGNNHSGIGDRAKDVLVSDPLFLVGKFDLVQNLGNFVVRDVNGFGCDLSLFGQANFRFRFHF